MTASKHEEPEKELSVIVRWVRTRHRQPFYYPESISISFYRDRVLICTPPSRKGIGKYFKSYAPSVMYCEGGVWSCDREDWPKLQRALNVMWGKAVRNELTWMADRILDAGAFLVEDPL